MPFAPLPHRAAAVLLALSPYLAGGCAGLARVHATPRAERREREALRAMIDSIVRAPEFRNMHWGVLVIDPERAETLYAHNAAKLFMPASNQKIITGAVGLARLGAVYRFRTTFAARGPVRDSALRGDLLVVGRGDPTVSDHARGDVM